jgi:hypothetical protein
MSIKVNLGFDTGYNNLNSRVQYWTFANSASTHLFDTRVASKCGEFITNIDNINDFILNNDRLMIFNTIYPILDEIYLDPAQGQLDSIDSLYHLEMNERLLFAVLVDMDGIPLPTNTFPSIIYNDASYHRIPNTPIIRVDNIIDDEVPVQANADGYQVEWETYTIPDKTYQLHNIVMLTDSEGDE